MKTKPLKNDRDLTWKLNLKLWWWDFPPVRFIHSIRVTFRRLKRAYHWASFMWTNWDFDGATIYPLLEHKLKRVEHSLKNGYAEHEDRDMKALRAAIKLARRLSDEYHETKLYAWHERKWGELRVWTTPCEDRPEYFKFNSTRPNIKNDTDKENERSDHMDIWAKEHKWRNRDEKWFYDILRIYVRKWWD